MRQPSIVIHKGKKEEKYRLYVEDYVISFIKEKRDIQDAQEIVFYGCREENGRKYTIYGAGQDRHLKVFDKYELLEEISCRVTQTGPIFLIKETNGVYEVKGYHVFYYDNAEMQDYLIHRGREERGESSRQEMYTPVGQAASCQRAGVDERRYAGKTVRNERKVNPHYAVSLQLGLVFLVLVAIVINSANSYDKLEQLNQSAAEVFFVMENQEASDPAALDAETVEVAKEEGENDIIVKRDESIKDVSESNLLQDSVIKENAFQEQRNEQGETVAGEDENNIEEDRNDADAGTEQQSEGEKNTKEEKETTEDSVDGQAQTEQQEGERESGDKETGTTESEEGVEALSRNVARYYEVERGDTLYMISQKVYGDTSHVKKICEINQITDPDNIRYGQKIILP